jgi:hypothetical protein
MPRTLVFVCIVLVVAGATADQALRILMRDLAVVTVRRGALANRTRGTWQLQMQCKGGDACASELHPDTIQCMNKGWDGAQTHWACEATVDTRVRLGSTNVRCEGWDRPGDDFVRLGSCVVDYELFFNGIQLPPEVPRSRSADDAALFVAAERRAQEDQNAIFVIFLLFVSAVGVAAVCCGHCNGHVMHTVVREEVHMPPPPAVVHHYAPTPTVWVTPAPVVVQQHHVHAAPPPMVQQQHHHYASQESVVVQRPVAAATHTSKGLGTGSSD